MCLITFIVIILYFLIALDWNASQLIQEIESLSKNIIFSGILTFVWTVIIIFILKNLNDKYRNQSNIKSFKDNLVIPDNLKELNTN